MDWSTLLPKIVEVLVSVALLAVVPALWVFLKAKIALVKDEQLREMLYDIVAAVEKMIPKTPDNPEAENAAKLAKAKELALAETGKPVPDYKIEAAVAAIKGVLK
jgi:hypothetical protein